MAVDHNSAKNTVNSSVFFALLGSMLVKAAHKINVSEIDPRIPFLAVLTHYVGYLVRQSIVYLTFIAKTKTYNSK